MTLLCGDLRRVVTSSGDRRSSWDDLVKVAAIRRKNSPPHADDPLICSLQASHLTDEVAAKRNRCPELLS
ncbi:MAG: hypothetical protein AAF974_12720, partial [Cyanobacteria bacterium P01_E01_bin.34]